MNAASQVTEPSRNIPVIAEADVCVLGGSCTGVFAAVRAARLGAKVVLVEKTNAFGGVATNGLVNMWHSPLDTNYDKEVIGGLTMEVVERLRKVDAIVDRHKCPHAAFVLNTEELKIELDLLVQEVGITPMLHTAYCAAAIEEGKVSHVYVENKDGRGAIRAKMFIDATGDGDLARDAGLNYALSDHLQPPTTCAKIKNFDYGKFNFREIYTNHYKEFGLEMDAGWSGEIPGISNMRMFAETHVFGANCTDAGQLTKAEMTGRLQVRKIMAMLKKYGPEDLDLVLAGLASYIGIRETRRFDAEYTLTEEDVLWGKRFPDAIANGTYRVDVHHPDGGGFIFKYLDGTTQDCHNGISTQGRWRDPIDEDPTFYQIPYSTMVSKKCANLIMAGRMISTDRGAFGGIRVMVNL
ncbi:MAG: FAD-dependent oxidoreductase, partial [Planctomycetes bacterium]|nr:FAD-dependent oxidoreductase [Planctomycetota bacterium]